MGFDEKFIDTFTINLPKLKNKALEDSLEQGKAFDYTHFSIVMNKARRLATYTAHNIDGEHLVHVPRSGKWQLDDRVGAYRTGNEAYKSNPWDRGHLVRRTAVAVCNIFQHNHQSISTERS